MSSGNSGSRYADESTGETRTIDAGEERGTLATVARYTQRSARSGVLAGLFGGVYTLRGLRSLWRGQWGRAVLRLFIGGLLLAVSRDQRASESQSGETDDASLEEQVPLSSSEETDPASQIGAESESDAESGSDTESEPRTEIEGRTDAASDIGAEAQTGRDTDAESGETNASGTEGGEESSSGAVSESPPESATYERLGEAAFDEHSNEVPVPQRAFDQGYLALGGEVFWGIRDADDTVFLSQDYDAVEDEDGVRYVASSEVDEDRTVTVPNTVINHWDDVVDLGTGVVGGDDLVFATTDSLTAEDLLIVVPEQWSDDLEWEE